MRSHGKGVFSFTEQEITRRLKGSQEDHLWDMIQGKVSHHMDSFIGAACFGYSLRQAGWPVTSLPCFHDGHNVQSPRFEGHNQPQDIIPVWLCFFQKLRR